MGAREVVPGLVAAALRAADPGEAVRRGWPGNPRLGDGCHVLAIGKGSVGMAAAAIALLGARRGPVLVTAVPEHAGDAGLLALGARVVGCDHPVPTTRNVEAAREVAAFVRAVPRGLTLLCLVSGGGSAHLTWPAEGVSLEALAACAAALQRGGATIDELNAVRKHCERLKGGRLAAMRGGAGPIVCLVMSDVIGDRLDVIASGPMAGDPTTFADALGVLERHGLTGAAPLIEEHLRRGARGDVPETPKPGDAMLEACRHTIVASNQMVVEAVAAAAAEMGYRIEGVELSVVGEAAAAGRRLAMRASAVAWRACWVIGGEPTVRVGSGGGAGGPSQELALAAAGVLEGSTGVTVLALSTDGRDGPTDAAGAVVDGGTFAAARRSGVDPVAGLAGHDSHRVLEAAGCLVRTGATGTNLNHVAVLLVDG